MRRRWPVGWDWPIMAASILTVCTVLAVMVYAGEIADAVKKWRRRW